MVGILSEDESGPCLGCYCEGSCFESPCPCHRAYQACNKSCVCQSPCSDGRLARPCRSSRYDKILQLLWADNEVGRSKGAQLILDGEGITLIPTACLLTSLRLWGKAKIESMSTWVAVQQQMLNDVVGSLDADDHFTPLGNNDARRQDPEKARVREQAMIFWRKVWWRRKGNVPWLDPRLHYILQAQLSRRAFGESPVYYYSLCFEGWVKHSEYWHCDACKEPGCRSKSTWHCWMCEQCQFEAMCRGCGGLSRAAHKKYVASRYGSTSAQTSRDTTQAKASQTSKILTEHLEGHGQTGTQVPPTSLDSNSLKRPSTFAFPDFDPTLYPEYQNPAMPRPITLADRSTLVQPPRQPSSATQQAPPSLDQQAQTNDRENTRSQGSRQSSNQQPASKRPRLESPQRQD